MNDGADDSDLIIPARPEPLDAGLADGEMLDASSSLGGRSPARHAIELPEDDVLMLDAYTEDDNAVTQQVAGLLEEPRWLVQFTSLDRRMLDTSDVISALLNGSIRRETLVWRGGMEDWVPVGRLDLLAQSAIPTLPPKRRGDAPDSAPRATFGGARGALATSGAPSVRARPLELALASVAIALSAATITTSFLSIAGVFDARPGSNPTSVQALRTEPAPSEGPSPAVRGRVGNEPTPPDPERATAVAH